MKAWALSQVCFEGGDLVFAGGGVDPGPFPLLPFGLIGFGSREFRLLVAVSLRVLAGHRLVPEFILETLAGPLVREIILAVGTQDHLIDIGARPDHVDMLAAKLLVHDDGAGLALKLQFFFEDIDGTPPLFRRHGVILRGIDIGVVKAFEAARPLAEGLPVAEGLGKVAHRGLEFEDVNLVVGVKSLEVPCELGWSATAATLDDHGPGPRCLPSASKILLRISM